MRIGLGAEALSPQLTGIGRYTWELAARLPLIDDIKSFKLYRDDVWLTDGSPLLRSGANRAARLPRRIRKWLTQREFERCIFHGPNFFFPPQAANAVITVHDLSVFRFPETHPIERIKHFERDFDRSITNARHIITDTEFIKREIVNLFGISSDKITPIPLGVSEDFFAKSTTVDDRVIIQKSGLLPGRFCLCVATIEPRKGLDHAVKSFLSFKEKVNNDISMVIVGASGWNNSRLHNLIGDASDTGHVKFLGFVTDEVLHALYRNCALFIYPSLYEGFGLPVLEAMASGAPTLISDRSCLPEVSGEVALMVNVEDHDAFARTIARALEDETWREKTISDGILLARQHSWNACAERTAAVYRNIMI